MDKEQIYALLEEKFVTYRDLASVPVADCGEPFVPLSATSIFYENFDRRMEKYTGTDIYIRTGLVQPLMAAQQLLEKLMPGHSLQVFYGYRHMEIQRSVFERVRREVIEVADVPLDEETIKEMVHRYIAVPEVAGHPTGGAVDVCIFDAAGNIVDMGTQRHENSKDNYVFSPFVSPAAWDARQKLRQSMLSAGFCPFDGEWWHFSYGDCEWAYYYKAKEAIYSQRLFTA